MKLLIEIPTEFESHFSIDRFKDALKRLEFDANYLAGNYEKELAEMLIESFQNAQPVESEIIRCKDCKNFIKWRSEESAKQFGQIYDCARGVFACPEPKDFCSHAERRTDG